MDLGIFSNIVILLFFAILITTICHRIKLPLIVGYIIIGVLVGPYALSILQDTENTRKLAEFGIVFLLFTIGLEFSLSRLFSMRTVVFLYGSLQVILTVLVTNFIGKTFGMNLAEAITIGCIVALSSTAIVIKQLGDQLESNSIHGKNAIGILLFQDLAVIPILLLIPNLVDIHAYALTRELSWALIKGCVAITLILSLGRGLLRPLFYRIAETRSLELFSLATLFVTLSCAWLTDYFGLSLALGAFLAGIMLGETEFRHQIGSAIRPFRDVLLGLFFISIGAQFNVVFMLSAWNWMLLLLGALIILKFLIITLVAWLFHNDKVTSLRTGIVLAGGGEFSFAILSLALKYKLLPLDHAQVVLGGLLLSMIIAPLLIRHNKQIAQFLTFNKVKSTQDEMNTSVAQIANRLQNHVIICGYGRVGQNIARFLEKVNIPYLALDLDPKRVETAFSAGENVCYADASQHEILTTTGLRDARALIVSFYSQHTSNKIIQQARMLNKRIPIIARTYDDSDSNALYDAGATQVIPDTLEASLMLATNLLILLKIPMQKVDNLIGETRRDHYDLLRRIFPGEDKKGFQEGHGSQVALHAVHLTADAYAVGHNLSDIKLAALNVRVTAIRHQGIRNLNPHPSINLAAGDVIVLYGALPMLEKAEEILLEGG